MGMYISMTYTFKKRSVGVNNKRLINGDILLTGGIMVISLIAMIIAFDFPGSTKDGAPGAGYFPIMTSIIVFILSCWIVIRGLKEKKSYFDFSLDMRKSWIQIGVTITTTILFIVLWNKVHFIILCSIYLFTLGILYGKKILPMFISSILTSLIIFYIFSELLNVMLNG